MFSFVGKVFIGTLVGVFTLWGVVTGLVVWGVGSPSLASWLPQSVVAPRPQTTLGEDLRRRGIYPGQGGAGFMQPVSARQGIGTQGGQWSGSRGSSSQILTPVVDVHLAKLRTEFDRTYDPGAECTKVKQDWERMTGCVNKRLKAWNVFSKNWQDKNAPHVPSAVGGPSALMAVNVAPGARQATAQAQVVNAARIRRETAEAQKRIEAQARPHLVNFVER